jgi:hypothetical protein
MLPLIATLTAEGGAVLLLYRLLREPGLAYPLAFGIAAWLLSSHLLYLGARAAGIPVAIRAVAQVTLPMLRRRVDRALAASVVTGALVVSGSPALAGTAPSPGPLVDASVQVAEPAPEPGPISEPLEPVIDEVIDEVTDEVTDALPVRSGRAGDPSAVVETLTTPQAPMDPAPNPTTEPKGGAPTRTPAPKTRVAETPAPVASDPAPAAAPVAPAATATSYTVVAGDSFWEIAARHFANATGRDRSSLTAGEIHGIWLRTCDANRARIRSGDVNLIHPGEVVELPPL